MYFFTYIALTRVGEAHNQNGHAGADAMTFGLGGTGGNALETVKVCVY